MVEVGSTIGNYEVLQKIGQGAMGAVFLARHPVIGKRVALKVIHPALVSNEEMVSRFFNEARAVTQIGHANIVDVQDFGQTPDGDSFIVMELLEGIGLGDLIRREGQLPIERAVHIARQLTDGLKAAHARGITHRDLKPDNIFLIPRGADSDFVKILDFGLAKLTGPGAMIHKTRTGAVLGTAHYMAPEAAEDARKADHRVDVYALGCILFQMLVGRVPFPGDGFGEVLVRHMREPPPMPSRLRADVPAWLEKIVLHALAKKPDFRFPTMEEFGRALRDPAGWERGFDDRELSEEELHLTTVRPKGSTPPPMEAVNPAPRSGPMRASQLSPDARTISADLGALHPGPAAYRRLPGEGTEMLPDPGPSIGEATLSPRDGGTLEASMVRRRTAGLLGIGASILGAIAILGIGFGFARYVLYGDVAVTVNTEPAGVEIVLGAHTLGTSPTVLKLRRGHSPVTLELQKAGYVTVRRSIEPKEDLSLDVTLPAEPRPAPAPDRLPVEPDQPNEDDALAPPGTPPRPLPTRPSSPRPPRPGKSVDTDASDGPHKTPHPRIKKSGPGYKQDGLLLAPSF